MEKDALQLVRKDQLSEVLRQVSSNHYSRKLDESVDSRDAIDKGIDICASVMNGFGFGQAFSELELLSRRNSKRAMFASLLSSSAQRIQERNNPSTLPISTTKVLAPTYTGSHLRFSCPKSQSQSTNTADFICHPKLFAKAAYDASNLYGIYDNDNNEDNNAQSSGSQSLLYDENDYLAQTDQRCPPDALQQYIKHLANVHILNSAENGMKSEELPLFEKMSKSALIALGVTVEELVRQFFVDWRQKGSPLERDRENVEVVTALQIQGSDSSQYLPSSAFLKSRVDAFFPISSDLSEQQIVSRSYDRYIDQICQMNKGQYRRSQNIPANAAVDNQLNWQSIKDSTSLASTIFKRLKGAASTANSMKRKREKLYDENLSETFKYKKKLKKLPKLRSVKHDAS